MAVEEMPYAFAGHISGLALQAAEKPFPPLALYQGTRLRVP
jgi:hypothetical protein